MMQRRHVDLVDVRPLFAIDFDVDEQFVHHDARGSVVFEALVRHHVAPVAGRVADGQQDRPSDVCFRQRFRAPRPPVDRIVLVLQEIRARFLGEPVFMPGFIGVMRLSSRSCLGSGVLEKGDLFRKSAFARIKPGAGFFGSRSGATFRSSFLTTFGDLWQLPGFDGFGTPPSRRSRA